MYILSGELDNSSSDENPEVLSEHSFFKSREFFAIHNEEVNLSIRSTRFFNCLK